MDRRKSLKAIALGTVASGVLLDACQPGTEKKLPAPAPTETGVRMKEELAADEAVINLHFFEPDEMTTIASLADIIIPKDDVSGSATEAGVPAFIDFIVNDMPDFQVPMRGGLRWLNLESLRRYGNNFSNCSQEQQLDLVNKIAYPEKVVPELKQGASFFTLMRNLTATGFYSTEMGWKDIGYVGNQPNNWDGVPAEVLSQYDLSYTDKELNESVTFKKA
jgi:hypothetical protein